MGARELHDASSFCKPLEPFGLILKACASQLKQLVHAFAKRRVNRCSGNKGFRKWHSAGAAPPHKVINRFRNGVDGEGRHTDTLGLVGLVRSSHFLRDFLTDRKVRGPLAADASVGIREEAGTQERLRLSEAEGSFLKRA